jgi:biotin transport system ATP-binding protein/energy-coupling factor transport system ATP-binding protein
MISIEELLYRYAEDSTLALDGISLAIGEGEHVALVGPNGCGKTTLVKHLNGLLVPLAGNVIIDGMNTRDRTRLAEIRRRVGMIFQNPDNQIVGMTLEEDVAFGPGNLRLPPVEIRDRVDKALAAVGLAPYRDRHPHTLSGGEKQLLALAGILAMDPRYTVLDEPTSSLDPAARSKVLAMMTGLKLRGITIIHATHTMEDAASADRVVVMDKGRIVADGAPSSIFGRVEWLKDLGLAPPPIAELLWRLRERGVAIEPGAFTIEEAAEALAQLSGSSDGCVATGGGSMATSCIAPEDRDWTHE